MCRSYQFRTCGQHLCSFSHHNPCRYLLQNKPTDLEGVNNSPEILNERTLWREQNTLNLSKISRRRKKPNKQHMTREIEASMKWSLSEQFSGNFLMIWTDRCAVYLIYFVIWCTAWDSSDFPRANQSCTRNLNSFHILKQICFDVLHPLPLISVNALICTCYVECEYVLNVAQTVCSWTLTLHKFSSSDCPVLRITLQEAAWDMFSHHGCQVTVEMGSVDQRKIRHQSFNCVSSVGLQLLLATLENTGIQSAFQWWRNLFF